MGHDLAFKTYVEQEQEEHDKQLEKERNLQKVDYPFLQKPQNTYLVLQALRIKLDKSLERVQVNPHFCQG